MTRSNIPGFTADASLYVSHETYRMTATSFSDGTQQISPQFWSELWEGIKGVGTKLIKVGCKTGCAAGGTALGLACAELSAGTMTPQCILGSAAVTQACMEGCG